MLVVTVMEDGRNKYEKPSTITNRNPRTPRSFFIKSKELIWDCKFMQKLGFIERFAGV
jgi:hypothetical protein